MKLLFNEPVFLNLLALIPLLIATHIFLNHFSRRGAVLFANFDTLKRVAKRYGNANPKNYLLLFIRVVVLICLIGTLAGAELHYTGEGENTDYVIAIDTSLSMLVESVTSSKFAIAKDSAISFIDTLPVGSSVGLVTFSDVSVIVNSLSTDKFHLRNEVNDLSIKNESGTDVGSAMMTGTSMLSKSEKGKKLIILTDGRITREDTLNDAITYARQENVQVYPVIIRNEGNVSLYNVSINEGSVMDSFTTIANLTNGKEFLGLTNLDISESLTEVKEIREQEISLPLENLLLLLSCLLLIYDFFIARAIFKISP